MPIHVPGIRNRRGQKGSGKRNVVMVLSLTAMVDLFTVLVVFLLQNYNTTGAVIEIHDAVQLPEAMATKELKPSNVVVVSRKGIFLNQRKVEDFHKVKEQEDWMVESLRGSIQQMMAKAEKEKGSIKNRLKTAVNQAKGIEKKAEVEPHLRISIQADKKIDFLTIKKIMYTITEAGVIEINFAVIQEEKQKDS